ncbi:MAG: hypothetical protein ACTMKY_00840 [Dermabacteraceae bacterium]|uniref:hypothetical protein n=1 Tax=Brachybacterium TaxID=43668 RepID=UPI003F92BC37
MSTNTTDCVAHAASDIRRTTYLAVTAAIYLSAIVAMPYPSQTHAGLMYLGLSALVAIAAYLGLARAGAYSSMRGAPRHALHALSSASAGVVTFFALDGLASAVSDLSIALALGIGADFVAVERAYAVFVYVALTVAAALAARAIISPRRDR